MTDLLREEKDDIASKFGTQVDDMKQGMKEKEYAYNNQIVSLNKECNEKIKALRKYSNMKVKQIQVRTSANKKRMVKEGETARVKLQKIKI